MNEPQKLNSKVLGKHARHGDILFTIVKAPDRKNRNNRKDGVVAEGETTGHAHRTFGDTKLYEKDGQLYLRVGKKGGGINHEEHGKIEFLPGTTLQVTRQREWTPVGDRQIAD